jgi:hypothetical protein
MRQMARVAGAAVAAALLASACAAPRNTLGTESSPCFRALPTAKAAVHHRGRLVGVRRVSRREVERAFPKADLPSGKQFCLVGFSGPFRAEDVDRAAGPDGGRYAVINVTTRGTTVLGTFLVDRLPLRLRH